LWEKASRKLGKIVEGRQQIDWISSRKRRGHPREGGTAPVIREERRQGELRNTREGRGATGIAAAKRGWEGISEETKLEGGS